MESTIVYEISCKYRCSVRKMIRIAESNVQAISIESGNLSVTSNLQPFSMENYLEAVNVIKNTLENNYSKEGGTIIPNFVCVEITSWNELQNPETVHENSNVSQQPKTIESFT